MTKKKTTLVNESVIRRWGKLANMAPLTENFIDTLEEEVTEEEDLQEMEVEAALDMEADGGEEEMEAEVEMDDAEVQMSEEEAEKLVAAIADAVSQVTGVDVDVESEDEMEDAAEDMEDAADDLEDMADDEAAMGGMDSMRSPAAMRKPSPNRQDETLDLEVIDDEALTEAVLKRVVERLLSNK